MLWCGRGLFFLLNCEAKVTTHSSVPISGVARICIGTRNLEAARRDIRVLLGDGAECTVDEPATGARSVRFGLANTTVELVDLSRPGPDGAAIEEGLGALVFGCDDIGRVRNEIEIFAEANEVCRNLVRVDHSGQRTDLSARRLEPAAVKTRNLVLAAEHQDDGDRGPADDPKQGSGADIRAVDHVVIASGNGEGSLDLFGPNGLGLRLALDQTVEAWGGRMLFFRTGKLTIEVVHRSGHGQTQPQPQPHGKDDRLWGIAYSCGDIDRCTARLADSGVRLSETRTGRKPGTRVATVKSHCLGIPTLLIGPDTPNAG